MLFEKETDKSAIEIDAPADGIINNVAATTGAPTPIGAIVAIIYAQGEAVQSTAVFPTTVIPACAGMTKWGSAGNTASATICA